MKQKFMGMSLWLTGFIMALIFGENRKVAILCLVVYVCSVGEHVVMKISKDGNIMRSLYTESVDT